jgi:cbb3-type cytochrome oxidase subunit 3
MIANVFVLFFNLAIFGVIFWAWNQDGKQKKIDNEAANSK